MREALTAALQWGFDNMSLNRVEALVHPCNEASLRLLDKLAFVREGTLRQAARWGGHFHDMLQLSLLAGEWKPGSSGGTGG